MHSGPVYYVITIVVPLLSLGVPAFRGVINDQALHEKEIRKELATFS